MLAVSPISTTTTTSTKDGCNRDQTGLKDTFPSFSGGDVDFPDFDSIDFDDLFGNDALPYLEMDPEELLVDFSVCPSMSAGEEETAEAAAVQVVPVKSKKSATSSPEKGRKMSKSDRRCSNSNSNEGKRKTKVDWTPDLHRRFVQAVEQLGVDKAVPSRILELMGIDCLTRHNVASHLQKYRSHRKHLLAREAEAANWTHKRQMYGVAVAPPPNGVSTKGIKANHQWHGPPTMGFPPPTPPPIHHHHPFRPLHVWGHPTHPVEHQSPMPIWPKPLIPPPSHLHHPPPHAWAAHPPPPPTDPCLWHSRHQRIPNAAHPMTPCFPHPLPTTRFGVAPPVPGIPPTHAAMYRPNQHGVGAPRSGLSHPHPLDLHPSKESIDAAIGEVLSKPWLPLPLGLKPPATDSVMGELERQGIPAIPPSCA